MTAWVHNGNRSYSGYAVKFFKAPPVPPTESSVLFKSGTSDSNGEINLIVPFGTKIVATSGTLTSNVFTCQQVSPPD